MKFSNICLRWVLLLVVPLFCPLVGSASDALYVGQSGWIDGPNYSGVMDAIAWYSDKPNNISISGDASGASIVIQSYFSGTATIECQYGYHYYVGTRKYNQTGHLRWNVSCLSSRVYISAESMTLAPGESATLSFKSNTSGYKLPDYIWRTKDKGIVTVDGGEWANAESVTITAVSPGQAVVFLGANTGEANPECVVTVKDIPATAIVFSEKELNIRVGDKGSVSYTLQPHNASSKISWSIANESIATVSSSGVVTGVSVGSTVLTATADNGVKGKVAVNITPAPTSVELRDCEPLYLGFSRIMVPVLTPQNTTAKFTWESSDPSIASVDASGRITGNAKGSVEISVKTDNGKTDSVTVGVVDAPSGVGARGVSTRKKMMSTLLNKTINATK